ncbi:MAG: hypothetical protein KA149_06440 [Chitinophagales bacterium]|nr:hypothetical protein [Chitinophagales bacterium]
MYIGDLQQTGFKNLLGYFLEDITKHALEKPSLGFQFYRGNRFSIEIKNIATNNFLDIINSMQTTFKDCFGIKVLSALSSVIKISIVNKPSVITYLGGAGNLTCETSTSEESENKVLIDCTLDASIFKTFEIHYDHANAYLKQFAMLNPGLQIISIDNTTDEQQRRVFSYPTGVLHEFDFALASEPYNPKQQMLLKLTETVDEYEYRIGICYSDRYTQNSFLKSYAGNIHTFENGSLVDGILAGIKQTVKTLGKQKNVVVLITRKEILRNLTLIAAIKGPDYNWYGSTKWKLEMPKVQKEVHKLVFNKLTAYFEANPDKGEATLRKFERLTEWDD